MAFAQTHGRAVMADINITPLVDVKLVLLVIFMITTPIMSHSIDIPCRRQARRML